MSSTAVLGTPMPVSTSTPPVLPPGPMLKRWLVSPWFDLFFLANMLWPLVALAAMSSLFWVEGPLSFVQIYFLSTPHRWITLALVFGDRDRFWKEPRKYSLLTVGLMVLGLALVGLGALYPMGESVLIPLMMLDYGWNAWHFAAQHAGISRIYGRMANPHAPPEAIAFEKSAIRSLVLWFYLRLAVYVGAQGSYAANVAWLTPWLDALDWLVFIAPVLLLIRELRHYQAASLGKLVYLGNAITLYVAMILAVHFKAESLIKGLSLAAAVFHAVEYLAVCNWSVQKKTTGIWRYQLSRTSLGLLIFMAVLGLTNYLLYWQSVFGWMLLTLLVSLLHYAYDGLIWRARPAKKA